MCVYVCVYVHPPTAALPLVVPTVRRTALPGQPAAGDILAGVAAGATVTSFTVQGSSTLIPAGPMPALVADPTTGAGAGTIAIAPAGNYTFVPAPGATGPVPPVSVVVTASDGQAAIMSLRITVNPLLRDPNEVLSMRASSASELSTNVLQSAAQLPPGTTQQVASFSIAGFNDVYSAGDTAVTILSPNGNRIVGSVVVLPNGSVTFEPSVGFAGQVPAIIYDVASSDGQFNPSALTITVQSGQ